LSLKYFKRNEFDCSHTGLNEMDMDFLNRLDKLRELCGFSFTITSGYRDKSHPVEVDKAVGGQHTLGIAADIKVTSAALRYILLEQALLMGFTGIGVAKGFIHVDDRAGIPVCWSY